MKILVVQDHLRSGGTERQSVLLTGAFAAAGHDTTLLTFRPSGALQPTIAPAVRQVALQRADYRLDWFAPGLRRVTAQLAPEVILCMGRIANCYAGSLQRALPASVVIATMRTGKPLPWLFRTSLRLVRHVVANSHEASATLTARYGVPAARISVIHNSLVFPPLLSGTERAATHDALRQRHGATSNTVVLLNVAMFRPEKNQRELVEIVAGLPAGFDVQLWLAGDGPARPACEALVRDRQLAHRVRFVGFHRDPSALYAAADIAVHASWSESLSNFLIEAQAQGLPAVAYQAQGVTECFVPGRTGWAIARDQRDAFRAQVLALAQAAPSERAALADVAQTFARATFDPTRQVEKYLAVFSALRATPRG
ncbi:glycosyltransferase [Opitutus sp. ER46]|uniref:glycosyltransferase n=1 Tax=Opitutus sp. ER46 TaxID=2161864 RepID=UPI000D31AE2A|nr:glycosyltransferase [Opitutus sp. ER46]PTX98961.1 glycosyltransferase [Opitutus sp. ER46]